MEVVFNFGGFYGSYYDQEIDECIYDEENNIEVDEINFKKLNIEICKHITIRFNDFLDDEYNIQTNLKYKELLSPKYYNYTTDKIILKISKKDILTLDYLVLNDSDVLENLKEAIYGITSVKSGYIPFYTYDEVIGKINKENKEIYYQCLLDTLINLNKNGYHSKTLELLNETILQNI